MDELLLIGTPFAVFLAASVWAGYAIGGSAADPSRLALEPGGLPGRLRRGGLVLAAAALSAGGAAAAAAAGAFARLTDAGFAVEPAAMIFLLEALVDLALAAFIVARSPSPRQAWVARAIALYWLCLAAPTMILADGGTGWISISPGDGMTLLGLPSFGWEAVAVVAPALLIWQASRSRAG